MQSACEELLYVCQETSDSLTPAPSGMRALHLLILRRHVASPGSRARCLGFASQLAQTRKSDQWCREPLDPVPQLIETSLVQFAMLSFMQLTTLAC